MPQAKKKQSVKTAKKTTARTAKSCATKKTCKKASKSAEHEKWHVYIMTALSLVAAILLCANVAIMAVM